MDLDEDILQSKGYSLCAVAGTATLWFLLFTKEKTWPGAWENKLCETYQYGLVYLWRMITRKERKKNQHILVEIFVHKSKKK